MCRVRPKGMLLDTPHDSLSSCPLRDRHLWLSVARVRLSFATTSLLITCTVLRSHGPFWTISRTITALPTVLPQLAFPTTPSTIHTCPAPCPFLRTRTLYQSLPRPFSPPVPVHSSLPVNWGTFPLHPCPSLLLLPVVHHPVFNRTSLRSKLMAQAITSFTIPVRIIS